MSKKQIFSSAAVLGMLGVILGALGAHALEGKISPDQIESYTTAVRYQVWHALALLILFSVADRIIWFRAISILWISGIILFSGSIYFLSLKDLIGVNLSWLGPITPLGGILLIGGWFTLLLSSFRYK